MKDKLKNALKAAVIAFIGALSGAAVVPDLLQSILKALHLN